MLSISQGWRETRVHIWSSRLRLSDALLLAYQNKRLFMIRYVSFYHEWFTKDSWNLCNIIWALSAETTTPSSPFVIITWSLITYNFQRRPNIAPPLESLATISRIPHSIATHRHLAMLYFRHPSSPGSLHTRWFIVRAESLEDCGNYSPTTLRIRYSVTPDNGIVRRLLHFILGAQDVFKVLLWIAIIFFGS